jgi:hypothetical protein
LLDAVAVRSKEGRRLFVQGACLVCGF